MQTIFENAANILHIVFHPWTHPSFITRNAPQCMDDVHNKKNGNIQTFTHPESMESGRESYKLCHSFVHLVETDARDALET